MVGEKRKVVSDDKSGKRSRYNTRSASRSTGQEESEPSSNQSLTMQRAVGLSCSALYQWPTGTENKCTRSKRKGKGRNTRSDAESVHPYRQLVLLGKADRFNSWARTGDSIVACMHSALNGTVNLQWKRKYTYTMITSGAFFLFNFLFVADTLGGTGIRSAPQRRALFP